MAEISVSAFAADFFCMKEELEEAKKSGADSIHIDVMDGHFVPLFGFSQIWIKKIADYIGSYGDVHLMAWVTRGIIEDILKLPIEKLTLHAEAASQKDLISYLKQISLTGIVPGLAISPQTNLKAVEQYFPYIKEILVMSCEPGTEGASFQESTYERIGQIRKLCEKKGMDIKIAVDGGLNEERAIACIENGADRVIIGRAFFTEKDKRGMVHRVRRASFRNL